jgi:phosphatidylglycerophosphate synthase
VTKTQKTIKELRFEQYDYHKEKFPYLFDFIRNPYSFLKARFYMENSAILVWLLLKTNIKPNTVSVIYGLAGIATGILLSIPNNYTIFIALVIAFNKGILDWSDGHLARVTGRTSMTGHILDIYGATLNSLGLQIGLGLYVANRTEVFFYYYLVILLLFFRSASLLFFSRNVLFDEISNQNTVSNYKKNFDENDDSELNVNNSVNLNEKKYIYYLSNFLDDRARSVDFICLIILLDLFSLVNISWILFLLIVIKYFIIFTGGFYKVARGGWAENEISNKLMKLHRMLNKISHKI